MEGENLFARKCDISGEGMGEGYCINEGEVYIKYKDDLLEYIKDKTSYASSDDAYDDDYYYYTDWSVDDCEVGDEVYDVKGFPYIYNGKAVLYTVLVAGLLTKLN